MRAVTLHDYKRRILRVLVHIQQNLDDSLALVELARLACFSPCHFHRVFKGMVGESVKEHVRRLRLERAASLLKLGWAPVTRIALDAGYASHEAFTRSFRSAFGVSPSQFRSARRRTIAATAPSGLHYRKGASVRGLTLTLAAGDPMKVHIENREPVRVAFMRHVGPYGKVGATWDKLLPVLGKEGLLGGDSLFLGVCHDDPEVTPPDKIRYDACVSVDESFRPSGDVGVQIIPGGIYAVTTHYGSYQKLGTTYSKLLGQWLPRSGRELRPTPCFEVYLNDPQSTDPKDLLTDIYAPLQGTAGPLNSKPAAIAKGKSGHEKHRKDRPL